MSMTPQIRYQVFGRDGLYDHYQLRDLIRQGEVTSLTEIAAEGSDQWQPAGNHADLQWYFSLAAGKQQPAGWPLTRSQSALLVAMFLIVIGFFVAVSSFPDLFYGMASSRWPTAEARLLYAQIVRRASRSRSGRASYTLYVGYEYRVHGLPYHSNAISFGSEFVPAVHQSEVIQSAKPLLVYYDPAVPSRAVLHPGVTSGAVFRFLIGAGVLVCGGLIAFRPDLAGRAADKISSLLAIYLGRR